MSKHLSTNMKYLPTFRVILIFNLFIFLNLILIPFYSITPSANATPLIGEPGGRSNHFENNNWYFDKEVRIASETIYSNGTIQINSTGSIIIESLSSLVLDNVTINFNANGSSIPKILVQPFGRFEVSNSKIQVCDSRPNSTVVDFQIICEPESEIKMSKCDFD
jgi:hypothetical protein